MRSRTRNLALALAAVALTVFAGLPATAQAPVPLEGTILEAGSREPIEGATIDIYRTDIKGKYSTKSNEKGNWTYPVPQQGTYILVISANGHKPQFKADVRPAIGLGSIDFQLEKGDGRRPTLEDVQATLKGGGESDADAEARAKREEEYKKALEQKSKFDARKGHFDAGIAAMNNKDYPTAISELSAATDGLEGADPQYFGELASVGGTNLAEVQYRVAVDLYNNKQRDEAQSHLEQGKKAIALALTFNPNDPVSNQIQGKILYLLVDRFSMADDADTGAKAFLKAAELKTLDSKKKVALLVQAGDTYRAAYMTDKAIETYKKALEMDASNAQAYYGIGLAAMASTTEDQTQQRAYWQTAADYLKAFLDKAPNDPRANEVKGILATLASDYKIKPKAIK